MKIPIYCCSSDCMCCLRPGWDHMKTPTTSLNLEHILLYHVSLTNVSPQRQLITYQL